MAAPFKSGAAAILEIFADAVLLLLFCLQAFLLGCFFLHDAVPLPGNWFNQKLRQLDTGGTYLQAQSFALTPDGALRLRGIQLYDKNLEAPVFEATTGTARFDLAPGGGGLDLEPASFRLSRGTLYLPALHSPNGRRTPVFKNLSAAASLTSKRIRITPLLAQHDGIHFRGEIEWPRDTENFTPWKEAPAAPRPGDPAPEPPETADRGVDPAVYRILSRILEEKERFQPLAKPRADFRITPAPEQSLDIRFRLFSPEFTTAHATGRNVRIDIPLRLRAGRFSSEQPTRFRAHSVTNESRDLRVRFPDGKLQPEEWDRILDGRVPSFQLHARHLRFGPLELATPRVSIDASAFPDVAFTGAAGENRDGFGMNGRINLETQSARIRAEGHFDPMPLLQDRLAPELPTLRFARPPYSRVAVRFGENFSLENADFTLLSKNFQLDNLRFSEARIQGRFADGLLQIREAFLQRAGHRVRLGLELDPETRDYRALIEGGLLPTPYNDLLPHWWEKSFRDFDFRENGRVSGEFAVHGNLRQAEADSFFGRAEMRDFAFRGLPAENLSLRIQGGKNYYRLRDLDLRTPDGGIRGNLILTSPPGKTKKRRSIRYDLETRLPFTDVKILLDEEYHAVFEQFELENKPRLVFQGILFDPEFKRPSEENRFRLQADTRGPLHYRDLPLEDLKLNLERRGSTFHLRDLEFGYARGRGRGIADLIADVPEGEAPRIRFQTRIVKMNQSLAVDRLPKPSGEPPDSPDADSGSGGATREPEDPRKEGEVDLRLHAAGPVDDFLDLHGYGHITIRNKELGAVQLLGPLSRAIQETPLGFTSLELEKLEGYFRLEGERIRFPELRITGPTLEINAGGTLGLRDESLRASVDVDFVPNVGREKSFLQQLRNTVNPVPHVLRFRLRGTLSDPQWRSVYDPRNLIPGL